MVDTLPDWFLIAAGAPILWCFSNLLDQFVAKALGKSTLAALAFIGLTAMPFVVVLALMTGAAAFDAPLPNIALMMLSSLVFMAAVYPYLLALKGDDASTAIPIFQTIPFFVIIMAWLFLGEALPAEKLLAGGIIIIASAAITWDFSARRLRLHTLLLMLLSSLLFAVFGIIVRVVAPDMDGLVATLWLTVGWCLCGLVLLLCARETRGYIFNSIRNYGLVLFAFGFGQEGLDVLSQNMVIRSMAIAPSTAHVTLVSGLQAVVIIFLAMLAGWLLPKYFPRTSFDRVLLYKLLCSGFIVYGLYGLLFW